MTRQMRERKRRELGVENKLVVGHVGRLNYIKNHKFLLDVFAELKKINADAVLLIVGEGEEKEAIEEKARRLGIENSVILDGRQRRCLRPAAGYGRVQCFRRLKRDSRLRL